MQVLLSFIVFYVLLSISLYKVFEKAGEAGWKGLVPGLNFVVWSKIIGRKAWWAALLLIPIVNIFIYAGMAIDMVRSFGKYTFWHSAAAVLFTPIIFFFLGFKEDEKYIGPTLDAERAYRDKILEAHNGGNKRQFKKLVDNNPYKKSAAREWTEAIIFAVFAAAFIRMFLIEAYVIPTSSMEGSLLVGDFLFVSKAHYGIRMPQTVAMVPLLHNRLPRNLGESYFDSPSLPYKRLGALETIDRNDPVVFNFPEGDSVYIFPGRTWSIYDYRRGSIPNIQSQSIKSGRTKLVTRPMDKKDHYIKRCIAVAGDTMEIRNRQVYLNGEKGVNSKYLQYIYRVGFETTTVNTRNFADWGISSEDVLQQNGNSFLIILSEEQKQKIQQIDPQATIEIIEMGKFDDQPGKLFPHDPKNFPNWTVDNFGPIYVPEKGATVKISPKNIALYRRIISVYEGNQLEEKNGSIFINGSETDEYTFKMDYYWMMGDNRHNSEDARVWGFVPEDHVVGKPLFIWFATKEGSIRKGINWKRIFSSADKK